MKKILLLSLAAAAALSAGAQSKLDASAALLASQVRTASKHLSRGVVPYTVLEAPISAQDKVAVIVTLQPGEDISVLEERGYEVLSSREDMAIVRMTADEMYSASDLEQVKSISLGAETRKLLYKSKIGTGVTTIQAGGDEVGGKAYDGTGVIVGLMDGGLDINHPNFLKADGTPRASRLFVITGNTGAITTYDTPSKIAGFTTDDSSDDHGTHVLGCMAGSFGTNGEKFSKVAFYNDRTGAIQTGSNRWTASTDFRGSAIASDIAAACGTTEGTNILLAAEKIYSYAQSQGKPAVMNISLGHNYGPHDGTDANSRYLSSIGNDMIICVSAGNEGEDKIYLHKDFTAGNTSIKTCPSTMSAANGLVDIWGVDNTLFKVTFQILEKATGNVVWSQTLDKNLNSDSDDQETQMIITNSRYNMPTYIHNEYFDKAFGSSSAVFMLSKIDPNNNRYNVFLQFQLGAGDNKYVPGIVVEGTSGKSVDIYGQKLSFYSNNISGYSNGTSDCTINGIATAKNVVSVGAYITQLSWPSLSGEVGYRGLKAEINDIASFSSYGKTFDGRQLPHVAGPGMAILSSISSYYTEKASNSYNPDMAIAYVDKTIGKTTRRYYWDEMQGTSMSSPFVAGVIALWLQADPTLTYSDVIDVINKTSNKDAYTSKAPERFGAGRINALEGIRYILGLSGIADITVDTSDFVVTPTYDHSFEIFAAGASSIRAELYSMSGALVASTSANGDTVTISASGATPGVYILRSTTPSGRTDSRKVVLK